MTAGASSAPGPDGGDDLPVRATPARKRRPKPPFRKPPLTVFPTTHWEYPSQHYGESTQGDPRYAGASPSWVVWQLLMRYTRKGDLVVDPMCGSGTTLDVARELERRAMGFDIAPSRADIVKADARALPLEDASADFFFIDPPYSTHIRYSDEEACLGRLSAFEPDEDGVVGGRYYRALDQVFAEAHRALKDRRYLAVYVSDSFRKRKAGSTAPSFAPIGFTLFGLLSRRFAPVDVVCVKRGASKTRRGAWTKAAVEGNYFLRGFNYLLIMKKDARAPAAPSVAGSQPWSS